MPNKGLARSRPALDRFMEKVEWVGDCLIWTGATSKGYGNFWDGSRTRRAHVWYWEHCSGTKVPDGLVLDHYQDCDTRCVIHVRPATQRENLLRAETSIVSINQAKSVCINGHSLADAYVIAGFRRCRICNTARCKAYRARNIEG